MMDEKFKKNRLIFQEDNKEIYREEIRHDPDYRKFFIILIVTGDKR